MKNIYPATTGTTVQMLKNVLLIVSCATYKEQHDLRKSGKNSNVLKHCDIIRLACKRSFFFCLHRGRGSRRREHRVRLCGLWRTEHHTHRRRPLLLQHGQILAMIPAELTPARADRRRNKTFQKSRLRTDSDVTVQPNTYNTLILFVCLFFFCSLWTLCQTRS